MRSKSSKTSREALSELRYFNITSFDVAFLGKFVSKWASLAKSPNGVFKSFKDITQL